MMSAMLDYIRRLDLYGVHLPISMKKEITTADDVKFLRANGVKWLSLWFVQETEQAAAVRSWGVDGFVTDYVTRVRKAYDNREEAKGEK